MIREMMKRGIIIDVDHMSDKSRNATLDIAEQQGVPTGEAGYPIVSSHASFREMRWRRGETSDREKLPFEGDLTNEQADRIVNLGGMLAPIANQHDIKGVSRESLDPSWGAVPNDCAGSSKTWAQAYLYALAKTGGRGVAIGTDFDGFASEPGPRHGRYAAFGILEDVLRGGEGGEEYFREREAQTTFVRYRTDPGAADDAALVQSRIGNRRFDINNDGLAHYGMLPDFFQDLIASGMTPEGLAPLFRSAEDYIQMWEKCERMKPHVR